ncbi:hypothetical protein GE09DRAFT_1176965 [Coniochaeta sp. 2T2.1]|nr:hypothetical protein GE09DRAFT_1176965 [Coniochaeta sp. 2T2.1]
MSGILDQLYPPKTSFTELELPDQTGKVLLITGGASGLGFEAPRCSTKGTAQSTSPPAPARRKARHQGSARGFPDSPGRLEYIIVDLADLTTVRHVAEELLRKESRLDVLFQKAGVMNTPRDNKTNQGDELQMGTNAIAPHLLARCLQDVLVRTAQKENGEGRTGTVRIVSLASMVAVGTPKGGVIFDESGKPKLSGASLDNYVQSKSGNIYLANEWASRLGDKGVVSVVVNPGMGLLMKLARYGAYTQLFAALSPEVTPAHNGGFIVPWGRFDVLPGHIEKEIRPAGDKEIGISRQFWDYCKGAVNGF